MIILGVVFILVLTASFYVNIFAFIVDLFQKNPGALVYIDEIVVGLVTLSIGFAVFSWRRVIELNKETEKCILAERELARMADTRAETERIISKQLHAEIEVLMKYLKDDREIIVSKIQKKSS